MRILIVHNYYSGGLGGEDVVFNVEKNVLLKYGNTVLSYERHNDEIEALTIWERTALVPGTLWMSRGYREVHQLIRRERPDVAHFHNTFPLISPSAYYACRAEGVPVVQTLHNYRLLCPNALFLRDARPCEACLGRFFPWPGIRYACYRDSRPVTATVAVMLATHRAMGTYAKAVDRYIALSEFARNKFIEGGLPAEKISIKPNFLVHDPGYCEGRGTYALFVGRLSEEKGVRPLLNAWSSLNHPLLRIVGDGPLAGEVQAAAASFPDRIVWEGSQPRERVYHLMQQAMFLVLPSICYENFPMTVVEAFACGTPILASKIGSLAEIVCDRRTGLHFRPGDPEDLAGRVRWLLAHSDELARMRRAARAEYEAKYTAERNYEMLMAIYEQAIAQKAETS